MPKPIPATVRCPTCGAGAPSIERIGGGKKLASGVAFGVLAAGTLKSTFRCKACSYKW